MSTYGPVLKVRVATHTDGRSNEEVQQLVLDLLNKCRFAPDLNTLIVIPSSRAAYEHAILEIELKVRCTVADIDDNRRAGERLATEWSRQTALTDDARLYRQPRLEIVTNTAYEQNCIPFHPNMDCSGFLLGTMVNSGEMLAKTYVHAHCADNSFEFKIRESSRPFTIVADFEHDCRQLTVYFSVDSNRDLSLVLGSHYKMELSYSQIDGAYCDFASNVGESGPPPINGLQNGMEEPWVTEQLCRIVVLVLTLKSPPKLWRAVPLSEPARSQGGVGTRYRHPRLVGHRDWDRVFEFPGCSHTNLAHTTALALGLPINKLLPYPECRSEAGLREWNMWNKQVLIDFPTSRLSEYYELLSRLRSRLRRSVYIAAMHISYDEDREPEYINFPVLKSFRGCYTLQALLGRCAVHHQLNQSFFDQITAAFDRNQQACEQALEQLLGAIDEQRDIRLSNAFKLMFEYRCEQQNLAELGEPFEAYGPEVPRNCMMVRKVIVTPSRQLLLPPEVMMSNRVLRHFGEENALRCVFKDDDGTKLKDYKFSRRRRDRTQDFDGNENTETSCCLLIRALVRNTLVQGVHVGGRRYEFLAWSNSQMRDHGCYLYAPIRKPKKPLNSSENDKENKPLTVFQRLLDSSQSDDADVETITTDMASALAEQNARLRRKADKDKWLRTGDIRKWMGDFSHSESLPKMMSRMGQCFTQAQRTIELGPDDWMDEPDIVGGTTGEYTFSDGIGRISKSTAEEVVAVLELKYLPSAFQVRYKGYKGMLCLDPYMEPNRKVIFRHSQIKFYDPDNNSRFLEIVKYSMPSPVYLNRPLINILDQVSEHQSGRCHQAIVSCVLKYLETSLYGMADMLCSERESAEALFQRVPTKIDFRQLRACGVEMAKEPFFRSMLLAIHRYNIKQHLLKSKVEIPAHLGRTMYGVMDESGQLQYGQIFVQYSSDVLKPHENVKLITGKVLVTKNPCLVPGDVRVFEAVDCAALRHLVDVVAFPRYGPRPHPDEMAGSDLDGDEFSIFWDKGFLFERNEEPMDFPKYTADPLTGPPKVEDMADFFVTYLSQDEIGVLSKAHLRQSDLLGIFHDIPNRIAAKCSIAVDFPKTGKPAKPLTEDEKRGNYPDFELKSNKPCYRSRRLVGRVCRKTKIVEDILDLGSHSVNLQYFDQHFMLDQTTIDNVIGREQWRTILKHAAVERDLYNAHVQSLLDAYGISDEGALVSGHILLEQRHQIDEMEKENFSFYNTEKVVELRFGQLCADVRKKFFKPGTEADYVSDTTRGDGRRQIESLPDELKWRALAWYQVTYDTKNNRSSMRSFPWLIWDVLAYIKRPMTFQSMLHQTRDTPEPVHADFAATIERVKTQSNSIDEFMQSIYVESGDEFRTFCQCYASSIPVLLFVLCKWAERERVFDRSRLLPVHLCLIFYLYAIGDLDPTASFTITRVPQLTDTERQAASSRPIPQLGGLALHFVRYLGCSRFFDRDTINFTQIGAQMVLSGGEWCALAAAAFKSYQYIALTNDFSLFIPSVGASALGRSDSFTNNRLSRRGSLGFQEMDTSVLIVLTPGVHQRVDVAAKLKEWSGCTYVRCRVPGGNYSEQILISAVGSIEARQRLQAILGSDPDYLADSLMNDRCPHVDYIDL